MDDTVHLGFVATTAFVLGLNLFFTTFLLNMINLDKAPAPPNEIGRAHV